MVQQTSDGQGSHLEPVEHNELDVVVGLRRQQLAVAVGGGPAQEQPSASASVLTSGVSVCCPFISLPPTTVLTMYSMCRCLVWSAHVYCGIACRRHLMQMAATAPNNGSDAQPATLLLCSDLVHFCRCLIKPYTWTCSWALMMSWKAWPALSRGAGSAAMCAHWRQAGMLHLRARQPRDPRAFMRRRIHRCCRCSLVVLAGWATICDANLMTVGALR